MTKLAAEQKFEIAIDMLCAKLTTAAVCYKHGISASCAYSIRNRALEVLRAGIGRSMRQSHRQAERLRKRVADLEQLAGDQALAICIMKRKLGAAGLPSQASTKVLADSRRHGDAERA